MTIIMTFLGLILFVYNLFRANFKKAFRGLMTMALFGFIIDMIVIFCIVITLR